MTNSSVETSFRLTNCAGLLDFPGCTAVKPYIDRQNINQTKTYGLAELFDKIDEIFSVSCQFCPRQPAHDVHICRKPP